jgi:large subunit ribosomal protein L5
MAKSGKSSEKNGEPAPTGGKAKRAKSPAATPATPAPAAAVEATPPPAAAAPATPAPAAPAPAAAAPVAEGAPPGGAAAAKPAAKPPKPPKPPKAPPQAAAAATPPAAARPAAAGPAKARDGYVPRLKRRYLEEVVPKLKREFGIANTMAVPRLERVSLNMGMGEAIQNIKILDDAVEEMAALAGQRPTVTRAQKSIAAFKLRAGMPIGCRVTLRGQRMWEFLDRFISVALPRVRDFRGVSPKSFDGRGNYTMGIRDHLIFLEIDYNKVERPKGMNVTIVTTAGNDERALYLLRELGMPFAR